MGKQTFIKVYRVPPGIITVKFTKASVVGIHLSDKEIQTQGIKPHGPETDFLRVIERYLSGEAVELGTLPLTYTGLPPDYIKLYEYIRKNLRYGKTTTYGELANVLNIHPRTVGVILSKNPLPILIPCHRVLAKHGPGGYSAGLKWKIFLLTLEGTLEDTGSFKLHFKNL